MKTVYIAGPMRGYIYYNFPAFDAARLALEQRGYRVQSPADIDREMGFDPYALNTDPHSYDWSTVPDTFCLSAAIVRDTAAILASDEVCLLPGWWNSKGAKAEKAIAEWAGRKVWEYEPESVLQEAERITSGDRQNQYGPPDQDFRRTAAMWTGLFADMLKDGASFKPAHVAQAQILLKMSRQLHQKKRDNWTDVAGYAKCGYICDQAEE